MEEEEEAQRPDDQLRLPAGTALLLLWAGWGRGRAG